MKILTNIILLAGSILSEDENLKNKRLNSKNFTDVVAGTIDEVVEYYNSSEFKELLKTSKNKKYCKYNNMYAICDEVCKNLFDSRNNKDIEELKDYLLELEGELNRISDPSLKEETRKNISLILKEMKEEILNLYDKYNKRDSIEKIFDFVASYNPEEYTPENKEILFRVIKNFPVLLAMIEVNINMLFEDEEFFGVFTNITQSFATLSKNVRTKLEKPLSDLKNNIKASDIDRLNFTRIFITEQLNFLRDKLDVHSNQIINFLNKNNYLKNF